MTEDGINRIDFIISDLALVIPSYFILYKPFINSIYYINKKINNNYNNYNFKAHVKKVINHLFIYLNSLRTLNIVVNYFFVRPAQHSQIIHSFLDQYKKHVILQC